MVTNQLMIEGVCKKRQGLGVTCKDRLRAGVIS